jgi:hypothetical protein
MVKPARGIAAASGASVEYLMKSLRFIGLPYFGRGSVLPTA